jgi:hypothetical protein
MTTKNWIITVVIVGATGVAIGRYTVPKKVTIQTQTVATDKVNTKTDDKTNVKKHKDEVIVTVKKPDGTVETTTKISEDTNTGKDIAATTSVDTTDKSDTKKETISQSGHLNLSFMVGANPFNFTGSPGVIYGGHVTRDILGPINIGIWGLSNGSCGASVGLTF